MAFGFPAYHTAQWTDPRPGGNSRQAILESLKNLRWKVKEETNTTIFASAGMNLLSWGEKITITFEPDGSVTLHSNCSMPTQCLDWGKNKSNIKKLIKMLDQQTGTRG